MPIITEQTKLQKLYEVDYLNWLEQNIKLLQSKNFQELDIDNLIEELQALGRSEKRAVTSLLEQIIRHLLLLEYWEEEYDRNAYHWQTELVNFRNQINWELTTNLRQYLEDNLDKIYQNALKFVRQKTKHQVKNFPTICPYNLTQLLDENWFSK